MLFAPVAGFMLLFGVASCGDTKPVEMTAEDNTATGDTAVVINDSPDAEALYRTRARRIADRVYTDLKLTDTTYRSRIATTYYTRAKRYADLTNQADTMGRAAAMREVEMTTDKEMQTVLTDPNMYKQYETRRLDYADDKYRDDAAAGMDAGAMSADQGTDGTMNSASVDAMDGDSKAKVKIKGEDGSKLKMKNGDIKIKDADGEKTKINGD